MTAIPPLQALELRITGQVQGVGYRAWTAATARRLGLVGWVRNAPDGSVAALIQGPQDALAQMVALCRRGPPAARVAELAQSAAPADPARISFDIVF